MNTNFFNKILSLGRDSFWLRLCRVVGPWGSEKTRPTFVYFFCFLLQMATNRNSIIGHHAYSKLEFPMICLAILRTWWFGTEYLDYNHNYDAWADRRTTLVPQFVHWEYPLISIGDYPKSPKMFFLEILSDLMIRFLSNKEFKKWNPKTLLQPLKWIASAFHIGNKLPLRYIAQWNYIEEAVHAKILKFSS